MMTFLGGLITGLALALVAFAIWAALTVSKWADELFPVCLVTDAHEPVAETIAKLRHQLAVCQDAARQQRERADYYYSLFCDGAKANAALRKEQR